MGDIKIKSIYFNDDDVIVWYNLKVGENSMAKCTQILAMNTYLDLKTHDDLLNYIKEQE